MKFVSATLSGDFSTPECDTVKSNIVIEGVATPVTTAEPGGVLVGEPYNEVYGGDFVLAADANLQVGVWCEDVDNRNIANLPDDIEVSVTFEWTHNPPAVTVD